jgi:hypothetical protein
MNVLKSRTYEDFPTPLSPVIKIFNVVNTEGSIADKF